MAIDVSKLQLVIYPAAVLRQRAKPVTEVTDEVRAVAARMFELMRENDGVGLAAPQVGLPWRLFVTNSKQDKDEDRVYINPRIVSLEGDLEPYEEGCLSLPEIRADIRRQPRATIVATDLEGREFTLTHDGLLARVWQHEQDHLDGILILNRMTPLDRLATRRAVKELESSAVMHE